MEDYPYLQARIYNVAVSEFKIPPIAGAEPAILKATGDRLFAGDRGTPLCPYGRDSPVDDMEIFTGLMNWRSYNLDAALSSL